MFSKCNHIFAAREASPLHALLGGFIDIIQDNLRELRLLPTIKIEAEKLAYLMCYFICLLIFHDFLSAERPPNGLR